MIKRFALTFISLCGLIACTTIPPVMCGANSWQEWITETRALIRAKQYRPIVARYLSPELIASAQKTYSGSDWPDQFIAKEIPNISFYLTCLDQPKIESTADTIRIDGRYDTYLIFKQMEGRYYLHHFGQNVTGM